MVLNQHLRRALFGLVSLLALFAVGCGESGSGAVLYVDAEFDPDTISDHSLGVNEANPGVAQTFSVLDDGKFEEFSIVVTDGESPDAGTIRITVRPATAGVPDPSEASSIIDPIDVDTTTLPATLVEQFTRFYVGDDPGRQIVEGEEYAIVVEFVSRVGIDTAPIARVLGQIEDPFAGGNGANDPTTGYVANTNDYFFRTFVLR